MSPSTHRRFAASAGSSGFARRPRGKRWRLLWIAGALAVLVGGAYAALVLLFPPERMRTLASAKLSATLARDVRFDGIRLSLWPPVRLSVRQPALAESGGFERGTAFEAQAVHLDLDVMRLLGRRIVVRRLEVDRPAVHLELRPDGTTNFDGLMKPPEAQAADRRSAAMELAVRELGIVDGRVLMDDVRARRRATFRVNSKVSLRAEAGGRRFATDGETKISELATGPMSAARVSDLNRSLAKLEWRIEHDGKFDQEQKRLALSRLGLRLGKAEVALTGIVDDPGPRARLDLHAKGDRVDLGAVMGFLATADARAVHGVRATGRLDFDVRLTGALGPGRRPDATGTLRVTDGSFRYPGAPAAIEGVSFGARLAPDSLAIGDLRARVAGQPVDAALYASRFDDPRVRFAVKGDLDLGTVGPLMAPPNTRLGGRVALDVRGSGRAKDPGSLALDGTATLSNVAVESPQLPHRVEGIAGVIRFSPASAAVSGFTARAGKSSFSAEATVTRPLALLAPVKEGGERIAPAQVDFSLASPHLDLAELLPVTPGAPLMPNATGGGRVRIAWLRSQKLVVEDVVARVGLEPGILSVNEFSVRAYRGMASGQARFDLREPARPVFDVRARVDSLDADAVLSAWTPVKGIIHGALGSSFSLSGAGLSMAEITRTITAKGLAAVANGTLGPTPALEALARLTRSEAMKLMRFKDGRVPFRVQNGRVLTDSVSFQGPNGIWRLSGSSGFDGSLDYAVSGLLPPGLVGDAETRQMLAAGALADPQGRVLLDLRIGGTVRSPKVTWDPGAMQDRLAGRVSQALEEQRAKLESQIRQAAEDRTRAAQDSARRAVERVQQAAADSLRRRAGDLLGGFFGRGRGDTAKHPLPPPPPDTARKQATPDTAKRESSPDTTK